MWGKVGIYTCISNLLIQLSLTSRRPLGASPTRSSIRPILNVVLSQPTQVLLGLVFVLLINVIPYFPPLTLRHSHTVHPGYFGPKVILGTSHVALGQRFAMTIPICVGV